jgi:AcrR family transcriptional regulator
MSPKNNLPGDAKRRIFDAAVALFVDKGYSAVGVREIAKEAGVNIAMINYYFGGKSGILKDILEDAFGKYYQAQASAGDNSTPPEERVRNLVNNVVRFFRENTNEALIFFNAAVYEIEEIKCVKEKWGRMYLELMGELFAQMGVDLKDQVHASIFNGFLGGMIKSHFQHRRDIEKLIQHTGKCTDDKDGVRVEFNDVFYQRYVDLLVDQYFHGVYYATQRDRMKYAASVKQNIQ